MKVFVGNLPFSVDDNSLKELFNSHGNIEEASVIRDRFSKRSKGFGFVNFTDDNDAKKAISEMHEKEIEGRKLTVNEAKPLEERPKRNFDRNSNRGFNNRNSRGPRRY